MKKQVEIFSRGDVVKLQSQINEFLVQLEDREMEVFDIKFTSSETDDGEPVYACMIIYTQKATS